MRERLIDLIRQTHCVDVWDYYNDDFKKPDPAEKLADHLIANGVIVPPCKMGDKIYLLVTRKTTRFDFSDGKMVEVLNHHTFIKETRLTKLNLFSAIENFGKTVFLTKDQAEQKLKEMIGNSAE